MTAERPRRRSTSGCAPRRSRRAVSSTRSTTAPTTGTRAASAGSRDRACSSRPSASFRPRPHAHLFLGDDERDGQAAEAAGAIRRLVTAQEPLVTHATRCSTVTTTFLMAGQPHDMSERILLTGTGLHRLGDGAASRSGRPRRRRPRHRLLRRLHARARRTAFRTIAQGHPRSRAPTTSRASTPSSTWRALSNDPIGNLND